jgi:uncharacterized membrane protein
VNVHEAQAKAASYLDPPGHFETRRVEGFSDAVFAIAITLLVLEISVSRHEFTHLWKAIADQWPSYLAYGTSFSTIGGLWLVHHGLFRRMRYATLTVARANLLLLMVVAFLPFPTRIVAESINTTTHSERAAVIFYGATLLVISAIITTLCKWVAAHPELLRDDVAPADVLGLAKHTAPSAAFYTIVLGCALFVPTIAAFGFLAIAIIAVISDRG